MSSWIDRVDYVEEEPAASMPAQAAVARPVVAPAPRAAAAPPVAPWRASRAIDLEASPCDACRLKRRCADELLACDAFAMFAAGETVARWKGAPRAPTRARFDALFG